MKKLTMPVAILLSVCILAVSGLTMFFCAYLERKEIRQHEMIVQASKNVAAILAGDCAPIILADDDAHGNYYAAGFDIVYNKMQQAK